MEHDFKMVQLLRSFMKQVDGSSADYAYGACGIPFAGSVELRDTGSYGFVLPESEIIPSGEETYAAAKAWAKYAMAHDSSVVV